MRAMYDFPLLLVTHSWSVVATDPADRVKV
jgi:hypothetical protein